MLISLEPIHFDLGIIFLFSFKLRIQVYTLMCDFLGGAAQIQKLERFGRLRNELISIATERLSELKEETRDMADILVSMEKSHFDAEFFRNLSTGPDLEGVKVRGRSETSRARLSRK